jgi:aspartyl/asparaginyl-tRNA synthetase
MVKYVNKISKEFIVDVEGIVSVPEKPIESAWHKVEIQARKVFCISKAAAQLPLNLEDTARSERELGKIVKENLSTLYTMPCWDDHHNINSFDVFI